MKYIGKPDYTHGTEEKLGVLLVNLGTPTAPETRAVRRYLAEFLSDPRIIELPRWLWNIILHGVVLRLRPSRSAKAYREVWSEEEGSPLLSISRRQTEAMRTELERRFGDHVAVALGMRYGEPSIDGAIAELEAAHVRRLIVLPMYPQYSGTTTASVFDAVTARLQRTRWIPEMRFVNQFCDERGFVEALAASVRESWAEHGRGELLVTSYHGIPKRYLTSGDPYHCLCHKTSRLLAEELGLANEEIRVVFQSRVGREEWLRPYCDETMKTLPEEGITSIDVLSPAFSARLPGDHRGDQRREPRVLRGERRQALLLHPLPERSARSRALPRRSGRAPCTRVARGRSRPRPRPHRARTSRERRARRCAEGAHVGGSLTPGRAPQPARSNPA